MTSFRRALSWTVALVVLATGAPAQVYAIHFKTAKQEKKFSKLLVEIDGQRFLVGEARSGITWDRGAGKIHYSPKDNQLFVADPSRPDLVPYRIEKGERVPLSRKHVITIQGRTIESIHILMATESLAGLAREYAIRLDQIEEFRAERDAVDKITVAWAAHHVRLVTSMQRLERWLRNTAFAKAADVLAKQLVKEARAVRGKAIRARGEKALASLHEIEPAPVLVDLAKEISGGRDTFHGRETQHLRIYYVDEIPDVLIEEALRLGEEIIEGFRAEFVDPYLSEDYSDFIPDHIFQEWLFVPDSDEAFEAYSKGLWNVNWEIDRKQRLTMSGGSLTGNATTTYKKYGRNRDRDLPAIVCHDLGHAIAGYHFGGGNGHIDQDWLSEAVAYYVSFEYLGRNSGTCIAFDPQRGGYVKREIAGVEGEKTVGISRRDVYNEVALIHGRPIDQLALKRLFEMDDADLAKSWSFFDFIARKRGAAGQRWLRAAGKNSFAVRTELKPPDSLEINHLQRILPPHL